MKKVVKNLNYLALFCLVMGFTLLYSFSLHRRAGKMGLALILIGLVLLGLYIFLNRDRWRDKNSLFNLIFASNLLVIILLVIAILGAVNYLGVKLHKRFDLTKEKIYSLSPQSLLVLRNLRQDIRIKAFISAGSPNYVRCELLLPLYRYYSSHVQSEIIDPYKNPSLVKRYDIKTDGTVVVENDKRDTRSEEVSEEALTNAIIKLTREREKSIYFLQGHGEPDIDKSDEKGYSEAKSTLAKLSFHVKKLLLFQENAIPADAAALILAGPQKPLLDKERFLLEEYLFRQGGRALLLLDPLSGTDLKPVLRRAGIILEDNVVVEVDPLSSFMGGDWFMPLVGQYREHPITKNFDYATLFPLCRGLAKVLPAAAGVTLEFLAATSPNSWGEVNYDTEAKNQKVKRDADDKPGPLNIVAAAEISGAQDKKTRLVVCGDTDFASNKYFYFQGNGNLFANMISWLTEESDLIAIAPKTAAARTIHLTQSNSRLIFFYCLLILPLAVFIIGIAIWLYRRKL